MPCGNELNKVTRPHPADGKPLSADAIRRGMESLNDTAARCQGKTVTRGDESVGCGSESVEQRAEEVGAAFLRKVRVLNGKHPIVLGKNCDGRLTFASTPNGNR